MEVTSVRMIKPRVVVNGTKAYASIVINGVICIQNIRVVETNNRLFVVMPQKKNKNGQLKDIVFATSKENREIIVNSVLSKYREMERKNIW